MSKLSRIRIYLNPSLWSYALNSKSTYLVPASLASSSFAIPFNLFVFLALCLFFNCWSALNFDQANTESTIPHFSSCLVNLSVKEHLDPNLFTWRVISSFVWESKVGLTIKQLTNIQMWLRIWKKEKKYWSLYGTSRWHFRDNQVISVASKRWCWEFLFHNFFTITRVKKI